jgi:CheY-like chemotaxis protein
MRDFSENDADPPRGRRAGSPATPRATEGAWRAQLHQLSGFFVLACSLATVIELLLAIAGQPVPLIATHAWRLSTLPLLLLAARVGGRLPVGDLSALAWFMCLVAAASHGRAAALSDHATGTAMLGGLFPLLVVATGLLPRPPAAVLRLSLATAGTFGVSYLSALPGDVADLHLLGPLLVACCLTPLAATALSRAIGRARTVRQVSARQAARLRDHLSRARARHDRFLRELSASMRNPLANVLGLADLLMEQSGGGGRAPQVAKLRTSAEDLMSSLVAAVDRATVDEGDAPTEETPFDLHATLDAAAGPFRPLAAARGLELTVHRAPSLPRWVVGDPSRMRQVLSTLIGNALGWTSQGGITIHASDEERRWDDHAQLRFVVQDTGNGLVDEDVESLLSDDRDACDEIPLQDGGSAASLGRARAMARRLGGDLGLATRPGWGCSAWFTCGVDLDVAGEELGFRSLLPARGRAGHRLRVLLVDDDAIQREVVTWMLETRNVSVLTAENGQAALSILEHESVHLVFMDVHMPVLDGLAATRKLRALERERGLEERLPVVALTAHALPEDREACLEAGMDGWVPKPVRAEAIVAALHRHGSTRGVAVPAR